MVCLKESSVIKTNCTGHWSAGCIQCKQTQIAIRNKWSFYHCREQGIGPRVDMQQQKGKIFFSIIITLFSKPVLQRLQSERVQINTKLHTILVLHQLTCLYLYMYIKYKTILILIEVWSVFFMENLFSYLLH